MKPTILISALLTTAGLLLAGCGDDEGASPDATTPSAPDAETGPPAAPTLGAQLDRMGRPAINTALNHTFDGDPSATQAAKDAWNRNADPASWPTSFAPEVAANLAILDGLDTNCGNQLLASQTLDATRYLGLAGVLADDRLWVKSGAGSCAAYLAVEADATGVLVNNECGGRTPLFDVIDVSYSVLAAGALSGVGDNVDADDATHSLTTFPFLADPS